MAPSHVSLIKEAIVLIDEFSGSAACLEDFIEEVSKDLQVRRLQFQLSLILHSLVYFLFQTMDASHKNFLLAVVSGCVEHKKLLDPVVSVFYSQNGKLISRRDCSQFASEFTLIQLPINCNSPVTLLWWCHVFQLFVTLSHLYWTTWDSRTLATLLNHWILKTYNW